MVEMQSKTHVADLSGAAIAFDGDSVDVSIVDMNGEEHVFAMTFEGLGQFIVKLIAVAHSASKQRRKIGKSDSGLPYRKDFLLPFPVQRYHLGLSDGGEKLFLRIISDNDLIWDFVMPAEGITSLQRDLSRLEAIANEGSEAPS